MNYITIQDTDIVAVNRGNKSSTIIYLDEYGVSHEIDFHTCALNYKSEHKTASDFCIGDRNIDEAYFLFYTSDKKVKVIFKKHYVFNLFRHHYFKGSKFYRFHTLQKMILDANYRTYDMS